MHFAVPGSMGQLYSMQVALTSTRAANCATAYLSAQLHQDVHFWIELCKVMDIHPTYLAEIFHRDFFKLWYCNDSCVGVGGVCVDPNEDRVKRVWRVQWPEEIKAEIISFNSPKGSITKSDLVLAALVLKYSVFPNISRDSA